ncbi:UspA domain-containing protein [Thermodesulfobium narugense DSM 14796]|uniref:UspA domain-containing protein n=1 Tax=Thermodesulfobium narugense DSM 14796 TaxID=747365 RepID=M1E5U3_9BACT|nr:universal stress protein [Thermodesulfobium narugense]AEE15277.1 UspA domain-containing protein [Thermodesulfobium narugense DSM 14796]
MARKKNVFVVLKDTKQNQAKLIKETRNYVATNNIEKVYLLKIIDRSEDLGVFNPEAEEIIVTRAESEISKFMNELGQIDCQVEGIVKIGSYHDRIEELAKKFDPEAIIVQSSKLSGIKRIFLGNTASDVINNAHCPVIVVGS